MVRAGEYLSVEEIAAGTGLSMRTIRLLARKHGWQWINAQTGRRGRPAHHYLAADVLATFGAPTGPGQTKHGT